MSGPQGTGLRPTSDKVRGALFSILRVNVRGSRFLDLYAGTGAIGIEALSRGAMAVTFVESNPKAVQLLRKNLAACGLSDRADVRTARTEVFLEHLDWWKGPYDIVFADPPYAASEEIDVLRRAWTTGLLSPKGMMMVEQHTKVALPTSFDGAALIKRYVYGDTALCLYGSADGPTISE